MVLISQTNAVSRGGSYSVCFFITKGGFKLSTITEKTDEVFRTL